MQAWLRRSLFAFVVYPPIHDEDFHVGFGEDFAAFFHAERIKSVGCLVRNACGIDEANFAPCEEQADFDKIASRPRNIAHENPVFAEERVYETGLARVRGAIQNHERQATHGGTPLKTLQNGFYTFADRSNLRAPSRVIRIGFFFGEIDIEFEARRNVHDLLRERLDLLGKGSAQKAVGVLEFRAVRAVNHVGDRFRLHQVHASVQKRTARVFAGFGQTNTFHAFDDLQKFADDNRVSVRVKLQNVFARV